MQEHRQEELQNMKKKRQRDVQEKTDEITKLIADINKEKRDREETINKLKELSEQSKAAKLKAFQDDVLIALGLRNNWDLFYEIRKRRKKRN